MLTTAASRPGGSDDGSNPAPQQLTTTFGLIVLLTPMLEPSKRWDVLDALGLEAQAWSEAVARARWAWE